MCGRTREDRWAQLALMDAMVFFAVSMLICATLLSRAAYSDRDTYDDTRGPRPGEALSVYLEASLGEPMVFDVLGAGLTGQERFGEALVIVSAMVVRGTPVSAFEPLAALSEDVLCLLCSPCSPFLRVSLVCGDSWVTIMDSGQRPAEGADTHSASERLGECDGAPLVATLVLCPSFLPQDVTV